MPVQPIRNIFLWVKIEDEYLKPARVFVRNVPKRNEI